MLPIVRSHNKHTKTVKSRAPLVYGGNTIRGGDAIGSTLGPLEKLGGFPFSVWFQTPESHPKLAESKPDFPEGNVSCNENLGSTN